MARRSSIDGLPEDVRRWLERALAENNFSGYQALEEMLREKGYQIGKSSIHRYGQKIERRSLRPAVAHPHLLGAGQLSDLHVLLPAGMPHQPRERVGLRIKASGQRGVICAVERALHKVRNAAECLGQYLDAVHGDLVSERRVSPEVGK